MILVSAHKYYQFERVAIALAFNKRIQSNDC